MTLAEVEITEANGAGETETDGITGMGMGITDEANHTPSSGSAIPRAASPAGFGMEKFEKIHLVLSNDSTTIDNFKVWKSNGVYMTDADLDYGSVVVGSYTQPTVSESAIATSSIPITEPASNLGGSLTADDSYSTEYGVFQYHADVTHPPGSINTLEITFQYDES